MTALARRRLVRAAGATVAGISLSAVGLACTSTAGTASTAGGHRTASTGGKVLPIPVPRPGYQLNGVAATSASNAWAVGCTIDNCAGTASKTVILHWNGSTWKRQSSPSPAGFSGLFGIAAVSARDAWAVGSAGVGVLILHWNGSAWTQVPGPRLATRSASLSGVSALSARSAWAVGSATSGTLILHWNGSAWKRVPGPAGGLSAVSATSARNAWAAGSFTLNGATGAMTAHWNGARWEHVPSPGRPSRQAGPTELYGAAASARGSAWAVGRSGYGKTLILQWNGAAWKHVPSPTPGGPGDLHGVAVTSATDVWAVGSTASPGGASVVTLILRWNGTTWTRVPSPSPGTPPVRDSVLLGVTATSAANAWAVGYECVRPVAGLRACPSEGEQNAALILHWNGTAWTQTLFPGPAA